ncbi:hypothetical protein FISHEDRAFT_71707 [Fistulina hepatica ATCC 64428]|uniref:Aminoglycoside phosphotransferase domain-containing protein n=1 Tax=Fistulina hepatica ATCC 64428 TaxID=1128425 RepID=A0A0D7AIJ2_9AGAR|nr:hypothetical protein FISHEDRAFT_71707 [Fistulina hepatica ATCC 64428]
MRGSDVAGSPGSPSALFGQKRRRSVAHTEAKHDKRPYIDRARPRQKAGIGSDKYMRRAKTWKREFVDAGDGITRLATSLRVSGADVVLFDAITKEATAALTQAKDAVVMGDFWPGNILVQLGSTYGLPQISIIDWELAKAALRGVDFGQFCAEMQHALDAPFSF